MRFEPSWPKKDMNTFLAKFIDASAEDSAVRQCGIHERQGSSRYTESGCSSEQAECVGIADARCPLVDCVVGCGGNNNRVCSGRAWIPWLAVLAANGPASLLLKVPDLDKVEGRRCRDDLYVPTLVLGEVDESADVGCGAGAAHDDIQNAAVADPRHR
jgi:hypothetical protein